MNIVRGRGRPACISAADEEAEPGTTSPWSSATAPTTPSAGASCSPTRRSATCAARTTPARDAILGSLQPLGRHRRPLQAAADHAPRGHGFCGIGRKRLLNILQARCEELGVKLRVRDRGARTTSRAATTPTWSSPATASTAAIRSRTPTHLPARHRHAPQPLRLARHQASCSTPSPSLSRRPSTAGSRPTPTASTTRPRPSSSKRPRDVARRRARRA